MPIYEYECPACGTTFEQVQHFNDAPLQQCPNGHHGVRRVFTPAGIIFKGSGFYTTDYRRNGNGNSENKSESKEKSESKAKSETK
ncbi:MAG: zinc ribbon domain-containing protein [Anaerolineae bacterium]|nr:zinc ribbon domain-containing protein [Anaerolineae bacterium]